MVTGVEECDVLVIGGGPAGSTAAALLAEQGKDVVLLEKEAHPRFHIGESLLPRNLAILDRLGVREKVAAFGVVKPGAEFVTDYPQRSVAFNFATGIDREFTYSYQVRRADFDAMLFATAAARGARTSERTRVTEVRLDQAGRASVQARHEDGGERTIRPRFVLDASGRDTFLAGRLQLKAADKNNNTAAVFAHFHGVECRTGELEGYISVHLVDDGWFWVIPLLDGVVSVGFVGTQAAFKARRGSMQDFLYARIRQSPSVSARMCEAELVGEVMTAGNYSYRATRSWGEGYMLIGDAFGFIDPVFSSGVLLAMTSGELGAEVAAAWMADPAAGRALAQRYDRRVRRAMNRLSWLIYRINNPVLRAMFMTPRNDLRMRDGIVSVLAGTLEPPRSMRMPILAFKGVYYALSLAHRFGIRPPQPAS
jgi:flavin-dependent dehydrogenase